MAGWKICLIALVLELFFVEELLVVELFSVRQVQRPALRTGPIVQRAPGPMTTSASPGRRRGHPPAGMRVDSEKENLRLPEDGARRRCWVIQGMFCYRDRVTGLRVFTRQLLES
jgi:hypothetical protein